VARKREIPATADVPAPEFSREVLKPNGGNRMGIAPTPILVSTYGAGNSADGTITRDAIDDLVGAMSSHLLIYLLAKKITPGTTGFVDRLANAITNNTPSATKTTSDSNFGGHTSITLSSSDTNPFHTAAGGFGIGAPPIAMPNSFSIVAGIRGPASFSGGAGLYGDGLSSNGGIAVGAGSSGNLIALINGSIDISIASFFATNTTYVFFYSYDSATKIHRYGLNSVTNVSQTTGTATRTSQGTSTLCYPFGEYSGASSQFTFNRWMLFGKAYLNGAVPSDDATFANLVSNYAGFI
jgi:hypothetical protein